MKLLFIYVFVFIGDCYCKLRVNDFGTELLHFTRLETDGPLLVSPFGLWTLLTGITFGTSGNSYKEAKRALFLYKNETKLTEEYKILLRDVLTSYKDNNLENLNVVLIDEKFTIEDEFRRKLLNDFRMRVIMMDFLDARVADLANHFIQSKTNNKNIKVFRSDDFSTSSMILANIIIGIKGQVFDQAEFIKEPFYDEENKEIGNVNMMFSKGQFPFSNIKTLKSYALRLPYDKLQKYSLLVLLPYPLVKISDIYQKFINISLDDIVRMLEDDVKSFGLEDVHVKFPRIRISTNKNLITPLNDMGVYDIFQPAHSNFERSFKDKIFVSSVLQKAEIDLSIVGNISSIGTDPNAIPTPYFLFNRPFLYYIVEKTTTTVIFSGIYSKPTFL